MGFIRGSFMAMQKWTERDNIRHGVQKKNSKKEAYEKKSLTKRQEASLKRHSKLHTTGHMKYMKRRMLMGDTMRQAHKKAMAKKGK